MSRVEITKWQKVKCFFGSHVWKTSIQGNRHGMRFGECCKHCGTWNSKCSVVVTREDMERDEYEYPY